MFIDFSYSFLKVFLSLNLIERFLMGLCVNWALINIVVLGIGNDGPLF